MSAIAAPSVARPGDATLAWRLAPFCAAALVLTVAAPLWLLLLAPLLLGVPHVVADVRYLLMAEGAMPRRAAAAMLAPLALLTALRLSSIVGGSAYPGLEVLLGAAAVAAAFLFVERAAGRRWIGLLMAAGLAVVGLTWPGYVAVSLGHLHNVIALGLWLVWARASARDVTAVVVLVGIGTLAIGSGLLEPLTHAAGGFGAPVRGLDLGSMADTLAPGLPAATAVRVVLLFAFAQAMHYAVWLVLLPAAARTGSPPRPFLTALRADLGTGGLVIAALASLAVPLAALVDAAGTRAAYLSLVLFHGWLEVAVIARWAAGADRAPWSH
jgi:hypothetical protein